ncbi:hypothetical protein G6F68_015601 [Rhizopus microsporus]|nr:hypothetical protein G6F68_015601 [Rhizopus microsporus]
MDRAGRAQGKQRCCDSIQFHLTTLRVGRGTAVGRNTAGTSNAEQRVQPVLRLLDLGAVDHGHHLAVLDDVVAVGQVLGKTEVLLDQHGGVAALFQLPDHAAQRLHDDRGQAFGDFVQQQQAGAGAQDARHRQHLLLAA